MMRGVLIVLLALALVVPAFATEPGEGGAISIMRPEKTPAPKHRRARKPAVHLETTEPQGYGVKQDSRRGSSSPVYPTPLPGPPALPVPPQQAVTPPRPRQPPPLFVPETGRTLPNLPSAGTGPGGAETMQDKSVRCAHQAGVYGPTATGNPNSYIGRCINQ